MPQDLPQDRLDSLLGICRRRWWLAVLVFVATTVPALAMIRSLPNTYRSTATILVEHQQVPEAFVKSTVTSALETRLHMISQETLSRSRLEALINRFGLYPNLRTELAPEQLIERMRKDIEVDLRSGTTRGGSGTTVAFAMSFRGNDPEVVAEVTNTLAAFYIEENLKARGRQAMGTSEFLRAQLAETKRVLDEQEERLSQYKRRYLGELPHQLSANLTSLEQVGAQLRINGDRQTRALWRKDALAVQLTQAERTAAEQSVADAQPVASTTGDGGRRLSTTAAATRLRQLRQQLTELYTKYNDKYPAVIRLKAEIAAVEREAAHDEADLKPSTAAPPQSPGAKRSPLSADPFIRQLQTNLGEANEEIQALRLEEARLRAAYTTYQARVENTPRREQEFEEVSRGHQTTQEHYQSLLKRYEEAQLAEDMEQRQKGEQFRVLDPAIPAQQPTAPNRPRLLLMTLVLSAGLAAGAVVLAERLDTSFHAVEELQAFTSIPVVVTIPWITTATDTRSWRRRVQLATAATLLGLAVLATAGHFVARGNEQLAWMLSPGGS